MDTKKESFLKILEDHKGIIFKVSHTYSQDAEDQKDLVQEVIIQLWNSFDKYDPRYKASTWIYRIALNVAISFYRKLSTRRKHEKDLAQHFLEIAHHQPVDEREEVQWLYSFINGLDEMNRALMILYLDGNSHEEIAQVLNISTTNVGTKINRIKGKIKEAFENLETWK